MISIRMRATRILAPAIACAVAPAMACALAVLGAPAPAAAATRSAAQPDSEPKAQDASGSRLLDRQIDSKQFAQNRIGVSPTRRMVVFLPAGYDTSSARYPVIYFLANTFETYRTLFERHGAQALFDRAIAGGTIGPFILVSVDMTTPLGSSWYLNSPVTGRWEDFLVRELVPEIDAQFRTLSHRDSRGLAGEMMGGYGAIRIGMRYPDLFGSIYALSPVGLGTGVQTMYGRPDWDRLASAKSLDDVKADGFSTIFTSIYQAHVPNPDKPPLFIDLAARKVGDRLVVDPQVTERLHESFLLERMIPRYAVALTSLRGFKFDWSRADGNYDHVYSAEAFARKLDEFGVPHEAEEYSGLWNGGNWSAAGRVQTDLLPFFSRHLRFDAAAAAGSSRP